MVHYSTIVFTTGFYNSLWRIGRFNTGRISKKQIFIKIKKTNLTAV